MKNDEVFLLFIYLFNNKYVGK